MTQQVIVWTNDRGHVNVCIPNPDMAIADVMAKDCPSNAIVLNNTDLPSDNDFFDAWILNSDNTVTVDFPSAIEVGVRELNILAKYESRNRLTNDAIGIPNVLSDLDWLALVTGARSSIQSATSLDEIRAQIKMVDDARIANLK